MCFEGKTQSLANRLKDHILGMLDNVDQAREMIDEYKKKPNSQIARMAELFYEQEDKFGITKQLSQVWSHPDTKRSALRGAIVLVLEDYIKTQSRDFDKQLLESGRRA